MRWKNKAGMVFDGVVDAMHWECEQNETCAGCRLSGQEFCGDETGVAELLGLELEENFLKSNERIASTNAVVIVDEEGNVTGWWENGTRMTFVHSATDTNVGNKEVEA